MESLTDVFQFDVDDFFKKLRCWGNSPGFSGDGTGESSSQLPPPPMSPLREDSEDSCQLPPPPLSPLREDSEDSFQLPPPPLSPLSDAGGEMEGSGGATSSASSSESDSDSDSSSSNSGSSSSSSSSSSSGSSSESSSSGDSDSDSDRSSDCDSDCDSDSSGWSWSTSSEEEQPEPWEPDGDEAAEAYERARRWMLYVYNKKLEQRVRRKRRRFARWLRRDINQRFADSKVRYTLLDEVLLRETYRHSYRRE
ncbi:hypothetical protein FJT64_010150 [Amphibalanus amphitrite]|uniref:Uncharacterized protein n=1 Tax=Amphibalanus amphitrite TaxID=1232801 RepID=A0A6A4VM85_AMPAM|nr:hypothetical protein FJT64_010150 [Amphibalanus amphitrite]